jgi:hypothetical protein
MITLVCSYGVREQVKEQRAAGLRERQVSEFVEDHEVQSASHQGRRSQAAKSGARDGLGRRRLRTVLVDCLGNGARLKTTVGVRLMEEWCTRP